MAALEPCYFEPNMLKTLKMIAVKIVKWITFESDGMTSHKHGLAAKYSVKVSQVASFEMMFFFSGWQALQKLKLS